VALVGPCASGKTTLAGHLCSLANAVAAQRARARASSSPSANAAADSSTDAPPIQACTVLPMDGFHLPRSTLD